MSGGAFDYKDRQIDDIARTIEFKIDNKDLYPNEIVERLEMAVKYLDVAGKMAYEIDYFLSGDTGEKTFLTRWEKDVEPLIQKILDCQK